MYYPVCYLIQIKDPTQIISIFMLEEGVLITAYITHNSLFIQIWKDLSSVYLGNLRKWRNDWLFVIYYLLYYARIQHRRSVIGYVTMKWLCAGNRANMVHYKSANETLISLCPRQTRAVMEWTYWRHFIASYFQWLCPHHWLFRNEWFSVCSLFTQKPRFPCRIKNLIFVQWFFFFS